MIYDLKDKTLVIRNADGTVRWQGRPDGYPVQAVSPLPQDGGVIVLLDYMSGPKNFANLVLVRSDGTTVWHAAPPDTSGEDAFVEFRWKGNELVANSWSGYRVQIDPNTGTITDQTFVK